MKIVISKAVALGNGTRQPGDVLADVTCDSADKILEAAATATQLEDLPAKFEVNEQASAKEVLCGLKNPQYIKIEDAKPTAKNKRK